MVNMEQLLLPMPVQPSEHESTELSQEQSVALVQIFLNASLACICYARELLDWRSPCFRTRRIGDISLDCSPDEIYHAFVSLDRVEEETSQEIRVLVRSQNHRANRILDMIVSSSEFLSACRANKSIRNMGCLMPSSKGMLIHFKSSLRAMLNTTNQYSKPTPIASDTREPESQVSICERLTDTFTLEDSQKSFKFAFRGLLRAVQSLSPLPGTGINSP